MTLRSLMIASALVLAAQAAQISDLSGTWSLNLSKSKWGKHAKPASAILNIDHRQPAFSYSGTIVSHNDTHHFSFSGAIDGQPYPASGANQGTISIHRVGANTTLSEFKSADGTLTETDRMTLSPNGKILTRELRSKTGSTEISWTEVYDRQSPQTSR